MIILITIAIVLFVTFYIARNINNNSCSNYKIVNFQIKGLIYRNDKAVLEVKNLDIGSKLILFRERDNLYDEFAIKVLTLHGIHIGYVDRKFTKSFCSSFSQIRNCTISKITNDDIPFVYANILVPENLEVPSSFIMDDVRLDFSKGSIEKEISQGLSFKISTTKSIAIDNNKDLINAERIKYKEPEEAIKIYREVAKNEKGYYSLHQICICYRYMKKYNEEKQQILDIISKCEISNDLENLEVYRSRLNSVDYFITKEQKSKDMLVANDLYNKNEILKALDIYLKYIYDDFTFTLAMKIASCYRKSKDKESELNFLVDIKDKYIEKISDNNKEKLEIRIDKLSK